MADLIPVRVRDCACPDTPHDDGDVVYLMPMLGVRGGVQAEADLIASAGDDVVLTQRWMDTFIRYGATGWNLLDDAGEPVPWDPDVIIADWRLARIVGDAAVDLYKDAILDPFLQAQRERSPTGRTAPTTSRPRRQTRKSAA